MQGPPKTNHYLAQQCVDLFTQLACGPGVPWETLDVSQGFGITVRVPSNRALCSVADESAFLFADNVLYTAVGLTPSQWDKLLGMLTRRKGLTSNVFCGYVYLDGDGWAAYICPDGCRDLDSTYATLQTPYFMGRVPRLAVIHQLYTFLPRLYNVHVTLKELRGETGVVGETVETLMSEVRKAMS